jgi:hypothetical protein
MNKSLGEFSFDKYAKVSLNSGIDVVYVFNLGYGES